MGRIVHDRWMDKKISRPHLFDNLFIADHAQKLYTHIFVPDSGPLLKVWYKIPAAGNSPLQIETRQVF